MINPCPGDIGKGQVKNLTCPDPGIQKPVAGISKGVRVDHAGQPLDKIPGMGGSPAGQFAGKIEDLVIFHRIHIFPARLAEHCFSHFFYLRRNRRSPQG